MNLKFPLLAVLSSAAFTMGPNPIVHETVLQRENAFVDAYLKDKNAFVTGLQQRIVDSNGQQQALSNILKEFKTQFPSYPHTQDTYMTLISNNVKLNDTQQDLTNDAVKILCKSDGPFQRLPLDVFVDKIEPMKIIHQFIGWGSEVSKYNNKSISTDFDRLSAVKKLHEGLTYLWADFFAVWWVKAEQVDFQNQIMIRAPEIYLSLYRFNRSLEIDSWLQVLIDDESMRPKNAYWNAYWKIHASRWQKVLLQRIATRILETFTCLDHINLVKQKNPSTHQNLVNPLKVTTTVQNNTNRLNHRNPQKCWTIIPTYRS